MELYEAMERFSNVCYQTDFVDAYNNQKYPKSIIYLGKDKEYNKKFHCQMYNFRIKNTNQDLVKIG